MSGKRSYKLAIVKLVVALALALTAWPPLARPAAAATYTVNVTSDENDGSCSDGDCSLRDAIILANTNPGADTISFNIPGCGGVCTIQPASSLPALSDGDTTIDGYSQPGAAPATDSSAATLLIQIDGSLAGDRGFEITSANNAIRGLAINRFPGQGISIQGSGAMTNTISGNAIGANAAGTAALGNSDGVYIGGAPNNTVGGDAAREGNLISGNDGDGVAISGSDATNNVVSGNTIGINATSSSGLGNATGISISDGAQHNTIGGSPGGRNVISSNARNGVAIAGSGTAYNTVSNNIIGAGSNGTGSFGNGQGVTISSGAQDNTIGPDNLIVHNTGDGVEVNGGSTAGNIITQNSIFSNSLGIDLVSDANGGIAAPVIVTTTGTSGVVGTTCPNCTVEVFKNGDTDGEGETHVASATATAAGNFTVDVGSPDVPYLTATTTDAISGTSEFSAVFTFAPTGSQV